MLSDDERHEIEEEIRHCARREGASIEALKAVQRHRGWVSDEGIQDIADFIGMTAEELDSVATFYNLIYRKPVGRHVILICNSVSCWVMGYEPLLDHLMKKLGIRLGETTQDDRFTLLPVPCLGICNEAPALMIDGDLHTNLEPGKIERVLEGYV